MLPTSNKEWVGQILDTHNRYRVDQHIGGRVFRAVDLLTGQWVAIKILRTEALSANQTTFAYEIALYRALGGDHAVQVQDYGINVHGYFFYVMEYLPGKTLLQLQHERQRLSLPLALAMAQQICAGLSRAHQGVTLPSWEVGKEPVVLSHQQLCPDHVMVLDNDRVKVISFGFMSESPPSVPETDPATTLVTTPDHGFRYGTPDQLDQGLGDARSDVYALGMMLYELISGADPFGLREKTGLPWVIAHVSTPPIPLRQQPGCGAMPHALETLLQRCLAKNPADRYPDALALGHALESIETAEEPQVENAAPTEVLIPAPIVLPSENSPEIPEETQAITVRNLSWEPLISPEQVAETFHTHSTLVETPLSPPVRSQVLPIVLISSLLGLLLSLGIIMGYFLWTKKRTPIVPPSPTPSVTFDPSI